MKGYISFFPCSSISVVESEEIVPPAKMLGSAIADGRYNGVCDGSAGLLRGQYDNDSSMVVDPLCDLNTDKFVVAKSVVPSSNLSNSETSE